MKLDIELIAFIIVFIGMAVVSYLTPQHVIDKYESEILIFVGGPVLGWFVRILLRK